MPRSSVTAAGERLLLSHEMLVVLLLTVAGFCSIPLWRGGMEISWDGLNHHFYLGWIAQGARFDRDVLAASSQSLQFPYLYWPAYKLAASGLSGVAAGVVLASLQALIAVPAWLLAKACMPGQSGFDAAMRIMAVLLSLMTSAILLLVDTTSVDVLASIPMLWSIALAVRPLATPNGGWPSVQGSVLFSGAAAGVALAAKLSNAPLAMLLPIVWVLVPGTGRRRLRLCVLGGLTMVGVFAVAYAYWGWLLWTVYGNPFYPMFDGTFSRVRELVGWHS